MSGKTSGLKLLLTGGACAVALFAAAPGPTQAALNSCPADFTLDGSDAKVLGGPAGTETAASDCQYIVPPDSSNVASIGNINANDFFGFDDWESNGQDQIGPGGAFGTWSIASVDFATYDYLIAFKDGADTNLIAFLFNEEFSSGRWLTPFTDPPFSLSGAPTGKDVSHYTIARRENVITIPEPSSLAMLGGSLVAMGLVLRRRKKAEAKKAEAEVTEAA